MLSLFHILPYKFVQITWLTGIFSGGNWEESPQLELVSPRVTGHLFFGEEDGGAFLQFQHPSFKKKTFLTLTVPHLI